jgi:hypothetical protein
VQEAVKIIEDLGNPNNQLVKQNKVSTSYLQNQPTSPSALSHLAIGQNDFCEPPRMFGPARAGTSQLDLVVVYAVCTAVLPHASVECAQEQGLSYLNKHKSRERQVCSIARVAVTVNAPVSVQNQVSGMHVRNVHVS